MLEVLNFVKGAIASKDFVPALTHFHIAGGVIHGFNGRLALVSPIDLDIKASPKALQFIKAIEVCSERSTIAMSMTDAGRLAIKAGKTKVFVDCIDTPLTGIEPEGELMPLAEGFIQALRKVAGFMAEDASRPWATGVLFRGESAFATNNVILVEHWLGNAFPVSVTIPSPTVKELLRIKADPLQVQVAESALTFHYGNSRWLKAQAQNQQWPDLSRVLNVDCTPSPIPETFFPGLETLSHFTDDRDRVFFVEGGITTHIEQGVGAMVEVEGLPAFGCYQVKQLKLLEGKVSKADFSRYPEPAIFFGENFRAAMAVMRS